MKDDFWQALRGYVIAVAVVLVTWAVWTTSTMLIGNRVSSSFFLIAIVVVGRFAGYGPSWLALFLGAIPVTYSQYVRLGPDDPAFATIVAFYFILGTIMNGVMQSERKARLSAERNAADALLNQRLLEREIAERKTIEQQLREQQQQLELALQAGRLGIWSWDVKTGRLQSTETQAIIHGRSPDRIDTVIDESLNNIHPDDRLLVKDAMERAVRDEAPERVTYRTVWSDSSIHWVETVGKVFHDESGSPNRVLGVSSDITEKKEAEIALREAEERFRLLAVHAPVGIAQSDAEGRTFFVNSKWCEIAGATPEEVMGYGWKDFLHPEDREQLIESWQTDMAAKKTYSSSDFRFIRKDGSIRWASSIASLIHAPDGQPIGQIGITEDITDRKAIENALRTRESQLSGILDNTSAVVYLKDSDGRYLLANRRYLALFQKEGDTIIGKTDPEFFPDHIAHKFQEADAKVWQAQASLDFEEVAPHADGLHTYRSVKFPVRDEEGRMIALGGISTDISDLKEAHDALKKQRELLRNLIDVQENERHFLCHEFHDGLIQYAVGSQMLLESFQSTHSSTEASAVIDTVICNLRKGIDDGRRAIRGIRPAVLDDSNIEVAIRDLIDQFSSSGMMVTFNCDPEIGQLPESVKTTIYRVAQEALNNARKHSGSEVVRIELRKSGGNLNLELRDFGCGFDVQAARTRGFGLLGMTERVRLLGGDCSIISERDTGTTIAVRLPIPMPEPDGESMAGDRA